jgi:N-acetylneuraminic acid mutarotase
MAAQTARISRRLGGLVLLVVLLAALCGVGAAPPGASAPAAVRASLAAEPMAGAAARPALASAAGDRPAAGLARVPGVPAADGTWSQPTLAQPAGRALHAAAWGAGHRRLYVFGGYDGVALRNDLLYYQADSNTWTRLSASGTSPVARWLHAAAWDDAYNGLYVFGGNDGTGRRNDLWRYDMSDGWHELAAGGLSARQGHTAVWDAAGSRLLVFGGFDGSHRNDLWAYNRATNTWSDLAPAAPRPAGRTGHTAVWDATGNRLLVFGGHDGTTYRYDLWAYQATTNTWVELTPVGTPPAGRYRHAAVWDAVSSHLYVFGGWDGSGRRNDLWRYQVGTNSWVELTPAAPLPAGREGHTSAWDAATGRLLVFGGYDGSYRNDLWAYQAATTSWAPLSSVGAGRGSEHTAVWDPVGNRMLVFGGHYAGVRTSQLSVYQAATKSVSGNS